MTATNAKPTSTSVTRLGYNFLDLRSHVFCGVLREYVPDEFNVFTCDSQFWENVLSCRILVNVLSLFFTHLTRPRYRRTTSLFVGAKSPFRP